MGVPFIDLKAQHAPIREELDAALRDVVDTHSFVLGPAVEAFEREFAEYLGVKHVIATNSGTTALQLALLALNIGKGDEVIVPAHTFIATAAAVSHTGATPVLVDVQEATGNIDPDLLDAAITEKTRAILPVHLYGQPCDLDPILDRANRGDIPVIEDACQAHGARYRGRSVGSFGITGCFSFYPGKNLGAFGEGGAVATDETRLADRIRRLRDHGQAERYHHVEIGYNARMEGIQGAVLRVKLRRLDAWNAARRERTGWYDAGLDGSGLRLPMVAPERDSVHHLYVVRSDSREDLRGHLTRKGIQTGIHYPVPVHLHEAYASLGHGTGAFPVAEAWAAQCLSLPMYPELSREAVREVVEAILTFEGNKTLTPLAPV